MKEYLNNVIRFWKKIWGILVVFAIFGSIIALFIASFVTEKSISLEVMNG